MHKLSGEIIKIIEKANNEVIEKPGWTEDIIKAQRKVTEKIQQAGELEAKQHHKSLRDQASKAYGLLLARARAHADSPHVQHALHDLQAAAERT